MRCDFLFQEPRFGSQKNHHLRKLTNSGIVCWGRYPYLSLPVPILLYLPFISGSWISWSRAAAGCFLPGRLDTTTHRCTEWKPRSLAMRWKSSTWEISNFLPFKEWKLIFIDLAAEKRCNNKWNWIMKFDVHLSIFFWGGRGSGCSKTGTFIANPDVTTGILRTTHPPEIATWNKKVSRDRRLVTLNPYCCWLFFEGG